MSDELLADFEKRMASRWGCHVKTVRTWIAMGEEQGEPAPLDGSGMDFVIWYRGVFGRDASAKIRKRGEELDDAELVESGGATVEEVVFDRVPVEVIEKALECLGLSMATVRAVEESERSYAFYERCRNEGKGVDSARRSWQKAMEVLRGLQKSDDAVKAAEVLLKAWVRKVWEPGERERREAIDGKRLGMEMRERLMGTTTDAEWVRVWNKGLEKALRGVGGDARRAAEAQR